MSTKTVVVVSNDGVLVDTVGVNKESDAHYEKFVKRLLGDDGSKAVLNYGWNGRNKLTITGGSGTGAQIVLDASEVVVPSTLNIGGSTLQQLFNISETTVLSGIRGTDGEIEVVLIDNPDAGTPGQPSKLSVLGLSSALLDRIGILEAQVSGMLRFDDIYYAGDGIKVDHVNKRIGVRLGTGLMFEDVIPSGDSSSDSSSYDYSGSDSPEEEEETPKAVAVDIDAIADEIIDKVIPRYSIQIDPVTHNMALYENTDA